MARIIRPEMLSKEFESLETELRKEDAEIQKELDSLQTYMGALSTKTAELEKKIDPKAQIDLKSIEDAVKKLEVNMNGLKMSVTRIGQKVLEIEARLKPLESNP